MSDQISGGRMCRPQELLCHCSTNSQTYSGCLYPEYPGGLVLTEPESNRSDLELRP